jgi:hypothetical protein
VGRPPAAVLAAAPADRLGGGGPPADDWTPEGLAADDLGEAAGVPFAAWVAVEAGLVRDRVHPADHDAYAQRLGVPAGQWQAVQGAWKARMMSDPRVGARFGADYQAALKGR